MFASTGNFRPIPEQTSTELKEMLPVFEATDFRDDSEMMPKMKFHEIPFRRIEDDSNQFDQVLKAKLLATDIDQEAIEYPCGSIMVFL